MSVSKEKYTMSGRQKWSTPAKMEQSQQIIFTPFNYYEWKQQVVILLRCKGLYKITLGIQVEKNSIVEKQLWFNRMDEAFGMICLSISIDILFHVWSIATTTPNEVWTKLEGLFGRRVKNRMWTTSNFLIMSRRTHQSSNLKSLKKIEANVKLMILLLLLLYYLHRYLIQEICIMWLH